MGTRQSGPPYNPLTSQQFSKPFSHHRKLRSAKAQDLSGGRWIDLIHAFNKRGSLDQDKLIRSLDRIDAGVARGTEILSNLNRFAHSLKSPWT